MGTLTNDRMAIGQTGALMQSIVNLSKAMPFAIYWPDGHTCTHSHCANVALDAHACVVYVDLAFISGRYKTDNGSFESTDQLASLIQNQNELDSRPIDHWHHSSCMRSCAHAFAHCLCSMSV